jgi:transcriptional regulator GlxA family with amidase domain
MDARIQAALRTMQNSKTQKLQMSDLARQVNLSPWHFMRLFKAETSVSPKHYLRSLKMKEAEALLKNSFLSVKEIINRVGFSDRSHFSRDFKSLFGHNPSEFRTRNQNSTWRKQL